MVDIHQSGVGAVHTTMFFGGHVTFIHEVFVRVAPAQFGLSSVWGAEGVACTVPVRFGWFHKDGCPSAKATCYPYCLS